MRGSYTAVEAVQEPFPVPISPRPYTSAKQRASNATGSAKVQLPALHPDFPESEAPHHRIKPSFQPVFDGWFIMRLIAIIFLLNAGLFLIDTIGHRVAPERLSMQPDTTGEKIQTNGLEQRVGTLVTTNRMRHD